MQEMLNAMGFRSRWIAYSAFFAVSGSLLKHHTPNFGWCGLYPTLDRFLAVSHGEIFRGTFASVMRPSLHVEKILGHSCGMGCVNTYYYLVYGLALFFAALAISWPLMRILDQPDHASHPGIRKAVAYLLVALPIYVHVFSYGSIVDAIYPAASIGIVALLLLRTKLKGALPQFICLIDGRFWPQCFVVAFLIFLLDMSRPYAIYVILLLFGAAVFQKSRPLILGILIGIILAFPYHINQFRGIGSPVLTNYTGCNLIEVFRAPGVRFPGAMSEIPQAEIARRCDENSALIKAYVRSQPLSALVDLIRPLRLVRSVFPAPFTPWQYKTAPDFFSLEGGLQWALWVAFIVFLYVPIVFFLGKVLPKLLATNVVLVFVSLAVFAPVTFSIVANAAEEAGRVGLSFVLPISFLASVAVFREYRLPCHGRL